MPEIIIALGSKENLPEDIRSMTSRLVSEPKIVIASGKEKEIRNTIIDQASNLFLSGNIVIVLIDPPPGILAELRPQIDSLKEKVFVVIFATSAAEKIQERVQGRVVVLEQDKEKRLEQKVRGFIREHGKKMTDKAFDLLIGRIKDESVLESELTKLVAYVGDKGTIESKDIKTIVGHTHEENLMALFEAFQKSDRKAVLSIFENLIDGGQYILAIQTYLVNQIRLLLQSKDAERFSSQLREYPAFAKAFKRWKEDLNLDSSDKRRYLPFQHPYYAFKLAQAGKKMGVKDLLSFFEMLTVLDAQIKGGTKYDRVRMECGLMKV
ncbi:MAG TPA: hypothetical protein VHO84_00095 [Syntrophorhabdaceae bacterium]|nr:hypothetical protein [Syntrophorhabdaceae bacterium]